MIAFTILSRAAYNITTPKVVLGKPESMEMGSEIIGNGVVEAEEIVPVSTVEQKVVRKVHVLAGQKVKAGDVLYELDLEKLQEEIGEKERELKSLQRKRKVFIKHKKQLILRACRRRRTLRRNRVSL